MLTFKCFTVPLVNTTKQVQAVQLWQVRWTSQHDRYPFTTSTTEVEAFPSKDEADSFALALKNAFKLIRTDGGLGMVEVRML